MKTIYTIPAPDSQNATIEVYGDPDNAWYEWRIIDGGRIVQDTSSEGRQYGQAEIALRDALMVASGLKDGYTIKTFKVSGNCYEIYGFAKDGKKVEIYFNPVDGSIIKKEVG